MTVYQFKQSLYNTKKPQHLNNKKPVQQKLLTWKLKQFLELFLLDSRYILMRRLPLLSVSFESQFVPWFLAITTHFIVKKYSFLWSDSEG